MPLKYPPSWKFDGFPHAMPPEADAEFAGLVRKIAQGSLSAKSVLEDFKSAYGSGGWSSSESWADTDLMGAMDGAMGNAALYVESFYTGMQAVKERGVAVPSIETVNGILAKWEVPLVIDPPNLFMREGDITFSEQEPEGTKPLFIRGRELGRGGFGVVYHVTRKTKIAEFEQAMKVLEPSVFVTDKDRAEQRFKREIGALAKLHHRGIVPLIEAGIGNDNKAYLLMPYIEGASLSDALAGADSHKVIRTFDEILQALEFAHNANVIHRDLKPRNILVRACDGQPIILDFGCAYLLDEVDDSLTTTLIGSSAYIPFEVHRNPKIRSVKQDVYACGVMLYEVIVGKVPHPEDYEPVEQWFPKFKGFDEVIQGALASEKKRIASASELRSKLNNILWQDI